MDKVDVQLRIKEECQNKSIIEVIQIIRKHGVEWFYDLNIWDTGQNIFRIAMDAGHISSVEELLKEGWDVNRDGINGAKTAFLMLIYPNEKINNMIVNHGVDLDVQIERGTTPMMMAAGWNDMESLKWFFQNGADPNIKDNKGNTVLHYVELEKLKEILPFFLEYRERWSEENWKMLKALRLKSVYQ